MSAFRLPAIAAVMIAGIVVADRTKPASVIAVMAGAISLAALLLAFHLHRKAPAPEVGEPLSRVAGVTVALLLLGSFGFGFSRSAMKEVALAHAVSPRYHRQVIEVRGKVVSDPEKAGRANGFILRTESIESRSAVERISVRQFGGRLPRLGDRVEGSVRVRRLDRHDGFDRSLYRRSIVAKATVSGGGLKTIGSGGGVLSAANLVRSRMNQLANRALKPREASLVLGLTIGDDRLMPEEMKEDFRTSSLSHLTAVSGTNVAIVLGSVLVLLRAMRTSRRAQVVAGLVVIVLFGAITRWEPSVLRATVMAAVALSAFLFGRASNPVHGLAFALIALLSFDPLLVWSIGFQLSFVATVGILLITPKILDRLSRWPRVLREAFGVAVGAQLAVTPLLAFHFGNVSLVSVPANLVAFPLVAPLTIIGFIAAVSGFVFEPLGLALFEIAGFFARLLGSTAHAFGSLPHAATGVPRLGAVELVAVYCCIAILLLWLTGRKWAARRVFIVVSALAVSILWSGLGASAPPRGLRITFFNVGQGDAALVESPDGARLLIDGGPDPHQVSEKLSGRGIDRLDIVVFSHAHFDHINGLIEVMTSRPVQTAIDPGVPSKLLESIPDDRRPTAAAEGDVFKISDLTAEVLAPNRLQRNEARNASNANPGEGSPLNNASIVLRIGWKSMCALFTGDVEEPAQQILVTDHRRAVECTIVKAPHHGSARLTEEFVDAVDPEFAVISVGENSFGHPTRTAISRFEREGARVLRTDFVDDIVLDVGSTGTVSLGG
jgi:competence protein ComEC